MVSRLYAESNRLTLWKTMSARIRGADTELKELGEDADEFTETTSKLRGLVMGLTGFDIMKDKNTKPTIDPNAIHMSLTILSLRSEDFFVMLFFRLMLFILIKIKQGLQRLAWQTLERRCLIELKLCKNL